VKNEIWLDGHFCYRQFWGFPNFCEVSLIYRYKTDNGHQAASILLEDGRCHVEAYQLERSFEKDYCRGIGSASRRTRQDWHSNVSPVRTTLVAIIAPTATNVSFAMMM
jgi:hypothetical protein